MYDSHCLELCTMYDSYDVYVDIMLLFFTVFSFHLLICSFTDFYLLIFGKICLISIKICPKIIDLSVKSADNLSKPTEFWYFRFLLFIRRFSAD
jgi:hypothetical protein